MYHYIYINIYKYIDINIYKSYCDDMNIPAMYQYFRTILEFISNSSHVFTAVENGFRLI